MAIVKKAKTTKPARRRGGKAAKPAAKKTTPVPASPAGRRRGGKKTADHIPLPKTKVMVVGVGGGGNTIVSEIASQLPRVSFVCANTDMQALRKVRRRCKVFAFGEEVTGKLGTGMDPVVGRQAAEKEIERVERLFRNVDLVILVSSLGGGTGSGATPIFAAAARKQGASVLGIFTLPFTFEGAKKQKIARDSLQHLDSFLQGRVLIANEKVFDLVGKKTPLKEALSAINQLLIRSLGDLIDVLYQPGFINIDFSDLRAVLQSPGREAYVHSEIVSGEAKAEKAVRQLFRNPLYVNHLHTPRRILLNLTGGRGLTTADVQRISQAVCERNPKARIIFGIGHHPRLEHKIKVTILAVGDAAKQAVSKPKRKKPKKKAVEVVKEALTKRVETSKGETPKEKKALKASSAGKATRKKTTTAKKKSARTSTGGNAKPISKSAQKPVRRAGKKSAQQSTRSKGEDSALKEELLQSRPDTIAEHEKRSRAGTRRNALDLKRDVKKAEKEILAEEEKWDTPAFLRKGKWPLRKA